MINPLMMKELAREHERDLLDLAGVSRPRRPRRTSTRARLGWSLVGLGARLALGTPVQS